MANIFPPTELKKNNINIFSIFSDSSVLNEMCMLKVVEYVKTRVIDNHEVILTKTLSDTYKNSLEPDEEVPD